jgi:hypothetical protein
MTDSVAMKITKNVPVFDFGGVIIFLNKKAPDLNNTWVAHPPNGGLDYRLYSASDASWLVEGAPRDGTFNWMGMADLKDGQIIASAPSRKRKKPKLFPRSARIHDSPQPKISNFCTLIKARTGKPIPDRILRSGPSIQCVLKDERRNTRAKGEIVKFLADGEMRAVMNIHYTQIKGTWRLHV